MSLQSIAQSAYAIGARIHGTSALEIDGTITVQVVANERRVTRDYAVGGQKTAATQSCVCSLDVWEKAYTGEADALRGKPATIGGFAMRVSQIAVGSSFVQIDLVSAKEAA